MFDVTKTQQGLTGLVGIRQPYDPAYQKIDATNLASRSGRFLNDISNFKVNYFIDTQDYADISDADLNSLLREVQDSSISMVCSEVFGDESYIDRNVIYSHAANRVAVETSIVNGFVGFKITPSMTKNVAFKITNVRLEFSGTGNLTLLMFSSSENAPIFSKVVSITGTSQVEALGWTVDNTTTGYKGDYYFGYIYDGTLIPFKRDYEFSNIENNISELSIEKEQVVGANGAAIFDLSQAIGLSENTGLNPDITVYDDFTDLIIQNEHLFGHAVQLQWAILIMQGYVNSSRSNRNDRMSHESMLVLQSLEGSARDAKVPVVGLRKLLGAELQSIRKSIQELRDGYFGGRIQSITLE
jgi:hypothetical protein